MSQNKRRIAVVTGTRAEYGLLYWLLKELDQDPDLELQLIVTGMHLSPEFGHTANIIKQDGFEIAEKVEMLLSSDTAVGIAKSMGLATIGFADVFDRLRPDLLVFLGDRYEILAAAQAAMVANIPMAHLSGGDTTEGAIDEVIRHALTKMAHLHFVSNEDSRRRVVQMGEDPARVFNFGAIGLDNIHHLKLLDKQALGHQLGFSLGETTLLVTYHPTTLAGTNPIRGLNELLHALDAFLHAKIIFTLPNAEVSSHEIIQGIRAFHKARTERVYLAQTLGQLRYLSALAVSDVVIGNSSSALIEAPALKTPTVNMGDRQKGRLRASSVIDCPEEQSAICAAIHKALSKEFRQTLDKTDSPYGTGGAISARTKEVLKTVAIEGLLRKSFFDRG